VHSQTTTEIDRRWASRVNAWAERASLTEAGAVIAVSASAARFARSLGVPAGLIHTVPNGIPARPLRERGSPKQEWTIGTVALLRPRKGLETLLMALVRLRDQGLPARLRVVGPFETDDYRRQVERLVADCHLQEAVEWTGFTGDVPGELARMDLFVLPSLLAEGLPMVLLEAMAAGVPVIGSNVDGVTDVIEDGRTGLLTPPGDADALAATIGRFIRGEVEWTRLRVAGHERQASCFSDVGMSAAVAEIYRQVLDR
jgi:glycosyltransferase involved in cell wall biosynthesis